MEDETSAERISLFGFVEYEHYVFPIRKFMAENQRPCQCNCWHGFSAAAGNNDAHTNTSTSSPLRDEYLISSVWGCGPLKVKRTQTHTQTQTQIAAGYPTNSPDAFLATRSRSNSTMMLKTCDMSPHRRNIFIDMVPVGLQYWLGGSRSLAWNGQEQHGEES